MKEYKNIKYHVQPHMVVVKHPSELRIGDEIEYYDQNAVELNEHLADGWDIFQILTAKQWHGGTYTGERTNEFIAVLFREKSK